MTNTSDSDPNFPIPVAPSSVILPSYNQTPRKKRTRISKNETGASSSSRPKPAKKPDLDAPNTCTECGKQFGSLKALFGHMRCHPERQWRGINPPPNFQRGTTTAATSSSSSWVSVSSEVDRDIASCLLMLANASNNPSGMEAGRSHQALGGHRATHKHIKGCFTNSNLTEDAPPQDQDKKRNSVTFVSGINHRCNICFRVFPSGQALGGHMRCHWERDQKEKHDLTAIDLNVPLTSAAQNLPSSSSDTLPGCSLDLRLGL